MKEQNNSGGKTRINENGLKVSDDETPVFLGNSSLQSPSEDAADRSVDPRQDTSMEASADDLRENDADRFAGSDRAGTAERMDNRIDTDEDQDENV